MRSRSGRSIAQLTVRCQGPGVVGRPLRLARVTALCTTSTSSQDSSPRTDEHGARPRVMPPSVDGLAAASESAWPVESTVAATRQCQLAAESAVDWSGWGWPARATGRWRWRFAPGSCGLTWPVASSSRLSDLQSSYRLPAVVLFRPRPDDGRPCARGPDSRACPTGLVWSFGRTRTDRVDWLRTAAADVQLRPKRDSRAAAGDRPLAVWLCRDRLILPGHERKSAFAPGGLRALAYEATDRERRTPVHIVGLLASREAFPAATVHRIR